MRDYREKDVKGCVADLSLQAYNVMIQIPLESVKDIIRVVERVQK